MKSSSLLVASLLATSVIFLSGSCKCDPKLSGINSCNGLMAPTLITLSETDCKNDGHAWLVRYDNGDVLYPFEAGSDEYEAVLPDSGTYEIQVDVDDSRMATTSFHVDNYPLNGEATSFFDDNGNIWTAVLDNPCQLPVLADSFNPQPCGGIDIFAQTKGICYVGESSIRLRFPNGQDQGLDVNSSALELIDIEIDNTTSPTVIYIAFLRSGQYFISRTTPARLAIEIGQGAFADEFPTYTPIEQFAFSAKNNTVYFTNSGNLVYDLIADTGGNEPDFNNFGNSLKKTSVGFNSSKDVMYFTSGEDECFITEVDPVTMNIIDEYFVPCTGTIRSLDVDEDENVVYYSDSENIWKFDFNLSGVAEPVLTDLNSTLTTEGSSGPPIKLPLGDLVFVRYSE